MKRILRLLSVSACGLIFTAACLPAPGGEAPVSALPVAVLRTGQWCLPAPDTWTATWISSSEGLRKMIAKCRSNRIGAVSGDLPAVDFDRYGVLAVEMGQRPSAGYGFDVKNVTAQTAGGTATVTLSYAQPAPGAVTAQVITSPWILIQLPAEGFRTIRVVDPAGALLAQIERP